MNRLPISLEISSGLRKPLYVAALMLSMPLCAVSQVLSTNNAYATQLQNNSILQSRLTNQMINLGGKPTSGSGSNVCLPPIDLQRGPAGLVPPALQGDPRYQAYLHCRYGEVPITQAMANAPALPVSPAAGGNTGGGNTSSPAPTYQSQSTPSAGQPAIPAQHLPISATDFVPMQMGHPVVDQQIASMPISPGERANVITAVNITFQDASQRFRPNNLAVAICVVYQNAMFTLNGRPIDPNAMYEFILNENDAIVHGPQFARMSDQDKQNVADSWLFQSALLTALRTAAQGGNPLAAQQARQLAQTLLQRLNSP